MQQKSSGAPALQCARSMLINVRAMQDGNVGLVRLAIEGQARRQVQKLTQTYLTLRWGCCDTKCSARWLTL